MRVRFRFTKLGKVRFTSHRDVARAWERALRRAELPVALTEGFNPRPKVHFGLALPTGAESLGEYLDVDFRDGEPVVVEALPELLSPRLPDGIDVEARGAHRDVANLAPGGGDQLQLDHPGAGPATRLRPGPRSTACWRPPRSR